MPVELLRLVVRVFLSLWFRKLLNFDDKEPWQDVLDVPFLSAEWVPRFPQMTLMSTTLNVGPEAHGP